MFHLTTIAVETYIASRTVEAETSFDIYCYPDNKSEIKIWAFKMVKAKYICTI